MRIAYFTDLHIGATNDGFHQQPRDPAAPADVVAAIGRIHAATPLDLLILGGDLTEHGSPDEIQALIALLDPLSLPVLICLGNHDLATPDAHARWQSQLAGHPHLRLADSVFSFSQADVIGINSWWVSHSGPALYWDPSAGPAAAWNPAQFEWLEEQLALSPDKPAILIMHAPIYPAPPALTGLPSAIHGESEAYAAPARELLERFPRVRLVLAGHSHINCALHHRRYAHLTTTSAIEVPFYARILEIEESLLRITTPSLLGERPNLPPDPAKLWAFGREQDRTLTIDLSDPPPEHPRAAGYDIVGWALIVIGAAAVFWLLGHLGDWRGIAHAIVGAIALICIPIGAQLLQKAGYYLRAARGHCPECGFDLRHSPGRCPECGLSRALWSRPWLGRPKSRQATVLFIAAMLVALISGVVFWLAIPASWTSAAAFVGMILGFFTATFSYALLPRGGGLSGHMPGR